MWSIACNAKFIVINSTIGFKPIKDAPTAIPVKPASVIGVSQTLLPPYLSKRPFDIL